MFGPVKGVISVTAALFARACQHGRCTRKRGPANSRTYKAIPDKVMLEGSRCTSRLLGK